MRPPHHTSRKRGTISNDWGTPEWVLDLVRIVCDGEITEDLASSPGHNERVRAQRYFVAGSSKAIGTYQPTPKSVVWCNPPGPCSRVKIFWARWLEFTPPGNGAFLIYNLDHWRQLPAPPTPMHVLVLQKRIKFVGATSSASFPSAIVWAKMPGVWHNKLLREHGHMVVWQS